MKEEEFQRRAEQALAELETAFGRLAAKHDVDVDLEGGVLRVTFEEPEHSVFVVNPNGPARQVWVSALLQSFKFDWLDDEQRFGLSGTREPLREVMQRLARASLATAAAARKRPRGLALSVAKAWFAPRICCRTCSDLAL